MSNAMPNLPQHLLVTLSALSELASFLRDEGADLYPLFSERLATVEQKASRVGWGFGDFVSDVVYQLAADLGEEDSLACLEE